MATTSRSRVFLDVAVGAEPAGRLTIELFTDQAPKTCENFRQLCSNADADADLTYAKSPFHRVIDEFMIQGGDITSGDGTGGKSIYNDGGEFEDENLNWREMDAAGLVCMANRGKDTNSSQFFITLEPCPHLNGKHTIFGHLVAGQETLQKISKVRVNDDDVPLEPVLIARCGELERRRAPVSTHTSSERPTLRGRRPSSNSPRAEEDQRNHGSSEKRKRRQSDALIDETLRGRPRARSDDEGDTSNAPNSDQRSCSPAEKHKRERNPSPSRGIGRGKETSRERRERREHSGGDYERRRRPSLPNQYRERPDEHRRDSRRRDKAGGTRDYGRRDGPNNGYGRRQQDSYRPNRDGRDGRNGGTNEGRLGGSGGGGGGGDGRLGGGAGAGDGDGSIKFKGRGSMKFREPDRRW